MPPTNTDETLALITKALGAGDPRIAETLRKAGITTGSGLVFYDLSAPARSFVPVLTPHRNALPRRPGRGGTAAHWKAITGFNTAKLPAGVSEGNRNGVLSITTQDLTAAYKSIGMEGNATWEAQLAGMNFDDARAKSALITLQSMMIAEEAMLLGGNASLALGITPTPTLTTAITGGSIGATVTVSVICVALTNDGYRYSSVTAGVQQTLARTNADGSSDTINMGAAQKSTNATIATGAGSTNSVSASVAPVVGAVAYAWFAGAAGSERIAAITTLNSVVIATLPGAGQLASALAATDFSQDALSFDGLLTYAFNASNNGYYKALATGTPGTGSALTSDGANGVNELNALFLYYWNTFKLSPDVLWVSAKEQQSITKLVVANGGASILRLNVASTAQGDDITAGTRVTEVINPITGQKVPFVVDPNMPAGTILSEIRRLPPGVIPNSNVDATFFVEANQDYYQIDWPARTRKYETGVYAYEMLRGEAPFSVGTITNIGG